MPFGKILSELQDIFDPRNDPQPAFGSSSQQVASKHNRILAILDTLLHLFDTYHTLDDSHVVALKSIVASLLQRMTCPDLCDVPDRIHILERILTTIFQCIKQHRVVVDDSDLLTGLFLLIPRGGEQYTEIYEKIYQIVFEILLIYPDWSHIPWFPRLLDCIDAHLKLFTQPADMAQDGDVIPSSELSQHRMNSPQIRGIKTQSDANVLRLIYSLFDLVTLGAQDTQFHRYLAWWVLHDIALQYYDLLVFPSHARRELIYPRDFYPSDIYSVQYTLLGLLARVTVFCEYLTSIASSDVSSSDAPRSTPDDAVLLTLRNTLHVPNSRPSAEVLTAAMREYVNSTFIRKAFTYCIQSTEEPLPLFFKFFSTLFDESSTIVQILVNEGVIPWIITELTKGIFSRPNYLSLHLVPLESSLSMLKLVHSLYPLPIAANKAAPTVADTNNDHWHAGWLQLSVIPTIYLQMIALDQSAYIHSGLMTSIVNHLPYNCSSLTIACENILKDLPQTQDTQRDTNDIKANTTTTTATAIEKQLISSLVSYFTPWFYDYCLLIATRFHEDLIPLTEDMMELFRMLWEVSQTCNYSSLMACIKIIIHRYVHSVSLAFIFHGTELHAQQHDHVGDLDGTSQSSAVLSNKFNELSIDTPPLDSSAPELITADSYMIHPTTSSHWMTKALIQHKILPIDLKQLSRSHASDDAARGCGGVPMDSNSDDYQDEDEDEDDDEYDPFDRARIHIYKSLLLNNKNSILGRLYQSTDGNGDDIVSHDDHNTNPSDECDLNSITITSLHITDVIQQQQQSSPLPSTTQSLLTSLTPLRERHELVSVLLDLLHVISDRVPNVIE